MKKKRIQFKLGDVFEVPLPNDEFAYGRVYDDAGIGIYRYLSDSPRKPPIGLRDFLFHVGMYEDILTNGTWQIVGNDPFETGESHFPPPSYIKDQLSGEYSIYHKGIIKPASAKEVGGLEETAVWDSHHIIDRILRSFRDNGDSQNDREA